MATDNPYPPPAPATVADLCANAAWRDDIGDGDRMLMEWSADTIRFLVHRLVQQAHKLEQLEATQ